MTEPLAVGTLVILTRSVLRLPPKGTLGNIEHDTGYMTGRCQVRWLDETETMNVVPGNWIRKVTALELLAMESE